MKLQEKQNKVKPTQKQRKAFENIKGGMCKRDAMLAAGYSETTSSAPKRNFSDLAGVKSLMQEYRNELTKCGIDLSVLAEVEAEGLFDQNSAIRLGYLKEAKKTLGVAGDDPQGNLKRRIIAEEFFKEEE